MDNVTQTRILSRLCRSNIFEMLFNIKYIFVQAEIRKDRLLIALEPEAASIYCQCLPPDKLTGASEGFSISDNDTKYLVVDIGGKGRSESDTENSI